MSDYPGSPVLPLFISTCSRYTALWDVRYQVNANLSLNSTAWPTANLAIYTPFWLPWPYPVRRLFWNNGSSAGNNWDIGIYTIGGVRLYSAGSTAASGSSTPQFVSPATPLLLAPGRYYLATVHSSITASRSYGTATYTTTWLRGAGLLQEASALPLPAVMTPAAIGSSYVPLSGFTRTASGY